MTPRNLKKHPSPENGVESLGIGGLVSHCGTFHVERCDFGCIQDRSLPEKSEELIIHQDFARSLTRPLNLTSFPSREMRRDKKKSHHWSRRASDAEMSMHYSSLEKSDDPFLRRI